MTLISGILFGFYDICTKKSLIKVSLLNVLMLYSIGDFLLVSYQFKDAFGADFGSVLLILAKSVCIFFAWMFSFMAIKNLPISIISPFNMLIPIFTIVLGFFVLNEKLTYIELIGIAVIMVSYYFIGKVGTIEVKGLFKNKFLYLMVISTFLSSISAIIDKFLLKKITIGQMQFWFYLFVSIMYISAFLFGWFSSKEKKPIKFSWFIVLMSIFLVVSDRIYFGAVKMPASEISIIMPLRRISIFVSAIVGGLIFKEKNLLKKSLYACLLIAGIALVFAGK
jgi:drug/metabolite transporter (DMT)-like permease